MSATNRRKLGEILIEKAVITKDKLAMAILAQRDINARSNRKFRLGEVLLIQKSLNLNALHDALRNQIAAIKKSENDIHWITQTKFK